MSRRKNDLPRELADVASVHAARDRIIQALSEVAANPLDADAARRMRAVLEPVDSPELRAAIRRLGKSQERPPLALISRTSDGAGAPSTGVHSEAQPRQNHLVAVEGAA